MAGSSARDSIDPLLEELLTRAEVVSRLRSGSEERLLRSILDAAVALFHARTGSIALVTHDGGSLEFTVAGGDPDASVVGLRIGVNEGIAGYVFQTAEAIAISDPEQDPRFDRATAEKTGLIPQSLLAVPLQADDRTIGVLEVLDCRDGTFPPGALDLASIFARQAALAIEATRVEREFPILVANALAAYGLTLDAETRRRVAAVSSRSPDDFWELVDEIAGLARANPRMRGLIRDLLPLVERHLERPQQRRFAR